MYKLNFKIITITPKIKIKIIVKKDNHKNKYKNKIISVIKQSLIILKIKLINKNNKIIIII